MRKGYRAKVARVNANRQENASIPAASRPAGDFVACKGRDRND
jgi:hypothetical protein